MIYTKGIKRDTKNKFTNNLPLIISQEIEHIQGVI